MGVAASPDAAVAGTPLQVLVLTPEGARVLSPADSASTRVERRTCGRLELGNGVNAAPRGCAGPFYGDAWSPGSGEEGVLLALATPHVRLLADHLWERAERTRKA